MVNSCLELAQRPFNNPSPSLTGGILAHYQHFKRKKNDLRSGTINVKASEGWDSPDGIMVSRARTAITGMSGPKETHTHRNRYCGFHLRSACEHDGTTRCH